MSDFKRHERSGGGRGDDRRGDDRRGGFGGDYRRGGDEGRRDDRRGDDRRGDGRRPRQPAVAISDNAVNTENFKNDEEGDHLSQPIESFEQLNVSEPLLRGIYSYGFEKPSPIQQSAIRPFLAGRDVIAQAQSGTGKTGSFCIGVLGRVDPALNATQAIILSNTRELALQIDMVFRQLGNYMGLRCNLSVKGVSIEENIESLTKADKPHVVIGTAGRILDMVNKRALDTKKIAMLVIDEADEMLSKCFLEQIYDIFTQMPETTQVGLYSATMGENFFSITKRFMRNPVYILVKAEQLTLEGIKQFYVNMDKAEYKFDTLCDIYSVITISQCIIYCNNRRGVEELTQRMTENNFTVSSIHGDMNPNEREITMADFRGGKTRVLISTDLLSRGIDVQQVSIVINYDIPIRVDNYLHRIGRSGRYGRKGVAINFRTFYDSQRIKSIEQYYNTKIDEMPLDLQSYIRAID